ncbi:MAG: hypothetical protein HY753_01885, partial [Nitrospirae bacterium]|nr:hypothetical protein [Nitrospirota bacterium]
MNKLITILPFVLLLSTINSYGHEISRSNQEIDVEEKLGENVPLDAIFF